MVMVMIVLVVMMIMVVVVMGHGGRMNARAPLFNWSAPH